MTTTPTTFAAYLTTVDGYGDKTLDVIPDAEGSGLAPVLSVDLPTLAEDADGDLVVDMEAVDRILRENGYRTVKTHIEGVLDQPGHWTNTAFGAVASVERIR